MSNAPAPAGAIGIGARMLEIRSVGRKRVSGRGSVDEKAAALGRMGAADGECEGGRRDRDDRSQIRYESRPRDAIDSFTQAKTML
jgi:hypothetical protein